MNAVAGPGYADVVLSDPSLKNKFTLYRGKPLVRANNVLCYGDMRDKYIVFIMILTTKKIEHADPQYSQELPDMVLVQIWDTDASKPAHERVVKQFEKNGLFEALDIGIIWMDKLNAE
ncbi:MAG: hypothetical protein ACOYID_00945 [Eubacteriales bacterium]